MPALPIAQPVFLVGFMGCGKTTLGGPVAAMLGRRFIDLDEWIEQRTGQTVAALFSTVGESGFRLLEREALQAVCGMGDVVVACGGGTPCRPGAMELMNACGVTVWLTASEQCLVGRLLLPDQKAKRPLVSSLAADEVSVLVHRLLAERSPYYARATLRFDATELDTPAQIAATARRLCRQLKPVGIGETK